MAETSRSRQLKTLASNLPGANQQVQTGLQEARKTQLQSNIKQMAPTANTAAAQQMGQQQQQQAGKIALQGQQQAQEQQTQVGQMALQEQGRAQRETGFGQEMQLSQQDRHIANKLAKLDSKYKTILIDDQMQFKKDKAGETLFNERQLMDYAASHAQSAEEFQDYAQEAEQLYDRKIQIFTTAHKQVVNALEMGFVIKNKPLDQASRKKLVLAKKAYEDKIAKAKIDSANSRARSGAITGILSAAVGAGAAVLTSGASLPYTPLIMAGANAAMSSVD